MIAIWNGLPIAVQLALLFVCGACAGALANTILFACGNVTRQINPWSPPQQPAEKSKRRQVPKTDWKQRVPIAGWLRLRHQQTPQGDPVAWITPVAIELVAACLLPLAYWLEVRGAGLIPTSISFSMQFPLPVRYTLLGLVGIISGAFANHVIYSHAHQPRAIAPWSPPDEKAAARSWSDRLPLIGWFGLRRESQLHGSGFWIRPILIELSLGLGLPALYWYETQMGGHLPDVMQNAPFLALYEPMATQIFVAHAFLMVAMVAATFIDFDEQTIPDYITVPGTILGLLFGCVIMSDATGRFGVAGFLPTALPVCENPLAILPTTFDAPWFDIAFARSKWATSVGLATGLAIWTGWCFALADRRFSPLMLRRRGLSRTLEFFFAVLVRHWTWKLIVTLWAVGVIAISAIHSVGGNHWYGLFSALVGMAAGGGTIWAIRIVASWAMDMEAMGFGDVTLMAMIGAFIGWQGAIAAFFLSPFAAIAIVLVQFIITKNRHVPFGPYLCAGTCLTVIFWDDVYNLWLSCNLFALWSMLQWLAIACLGLMAVLLFLMRMVRRMFSQ